MIDRDSKIISKALRILYSENPPINIGGNIFRVQSESDSAKQYRVNIGRKKTCECKYWKDKKKSCKHIVACQLDADDEVAEQLWRSDRKIRKQTRYPNPPGYDRAKSHEAVAVAELLRCLSFQVPYLDPNGAGRPPIPWGDVLFCKTFAAYHAKPSRRAIIDPQWYRHRRFLRGDPPAAQTIRRYGLDPDLEKHLISAIRKVVDVVHPLEHTGIADATYVRQPINDFPLRTVRGKKRRVRRIRNSKLHFLAGSKTHVIYAVHVTEQDRNDRICLKPLLEELAAQNKKFQRLAADNGYCSRDNYDMVHRSGMVPFLDFASDSKPNEGSLIWTRQYWEWKNDTPRWHEGYDPRKLIEAVNHAFKTTLTRRIRSKKNQSTRNEALAYVLAFNLTRLVMAYVEYGINIPWADDRAIAALNDALPKVRKKAA